MSILHARFISFGIVVEVAATTIYLQLFFWSASTAEYHY